MRGSQLSEDSPPMIAGVFTGDSQRSQPSRRSPDASLAARAISAASVSMAVSQVARAPASLTNRLLDMFCRKKRWQVIAATLCGALAIWVHASSHASQWLFGANGSNWEKSWVWWLIAVPLDVSLVIFFARYLASFLFRVWLRDLADSLIIRETIVKVFSGIVEDKRFHSTVASLLEADEVVRGVSSLVCGVMGNPGVHQALSSAVAGILQSGTTADASLQCLSGALRHEHVMAEVECFLNSQEVGNVCTLQFARVLEDDRVREACAGLINSLAGDDQVRGVLHQRAVSFLRDGKLYQAGGQGFKSAILPGRCWGTPEHSPTEHQHDS